MKFQRVMRSPNGEDVIYIFHRRDEGRSILLPYNMIRKEVQNPIHCHGFSIFADGRLVIFRSTSDEPTRVHPMQIWQTPFMSDEHAAAAPTTGSYLERVGNSDLVQGISDTFSVCRLVEAQEPSLQVYEDLIAATVRVADAYYWLDHSEIGDLLAPLKQVRSTGELIVDEFEKVQTIRRQAEEAVAAAETAMDDLFNRLRAQEMTSVDRFVAGLAELRNQRGHLIGLKELRYADLERIDRLEAQIIEQFDELSGRAVDFLVGEEALRPYHTEIDELITRAEAIEKATEVIGSLKIDDATIRTQILEGISEVLSSLNRARAILEAAQGAALDRGRRRVRGPIQALQPGRQRRPGSGRHPGEVRRAALQANAPARGAREPLRRVRPVHRAARHQARGRLRGIQLQEAEPGRRACAGPSG